jgi:hypothetical protein
VRDWVPQVVGCNQEKEEGWDGTYIQRGGTPKTVASVLELVCASAESFFLAVN